MKIQKKTALLGILILVSSLFLGISQVQARATKISFESLEFLSGPLPGPEPGPPGKVWIKGGILHIRDQLFLFAVVDGDLFGTVEYLANWNIDLATNSGVGWGSNCFSGEWVSEGPYTGPVSWDGFSVIKVTDFGKPNMFVSGKYVGHGGDGLEGMLIKGIFETHPTIPYGTILAGTVLSPHG